MCVPIVSIEVTIPTGGGGGGGKVFKGRLCLSPQCKTLPIKFLKESYTITVFPSPLLERRALHKLDHSFFLTGII